MSNKKEIAETIACACVSCGSTSIGGIKLEECDPNSLDVRNGIFDEHVCVQPAAIAYFGHLRKMAGRHLENLKHGHDRWYKKIYSATKAAMSGGKATIADIEAQIIADHEPDIQKWETQIEAAQEQLDNAEVWYEAWRTKGFSMREHAALAVDEYYTSDSIRKDVDNGEVSERRNKKVMRGEEFEQSKRDVRGIMGKRKSV